MGRCRDYFGFVVWFAGIGYVVLWPFSASGPHGDPFGAAVLCGDASTGMIATLCVLPHPFTLPVGLHLMGSAAAALVAARLSCRLLRRLRSRPAVITAEALNARLPGAIPDRTKLPVRRLRKVKPRTHFGLRGVPR